jgi:hypothetical protein
LTTSEEEEEENLKAEEKKRKLFWQGVLSARRASLSRTEKRKSL